MSIHSDVTRYARKIATMVRFADDLAKLGTDERIGVGCVVFPVDCSAVVGIGYNGAAEGLAHDGIRTSGQIGSGMSGAAHAEANAMTKMLPTTEHCILCTTLCPCPYCAPLIVNKRRVVGVIVGGKLPDQASGLHIISAAGIPVLGSGTIEELSRRESGGSAEAVRVLRWWKSLRSERPRMGGAD